MKINFLIFAFFLKVIAKKCTLEKEAKYMYSDCYTTTNTANVHFYYDKECNKVTYPETKESSEPLPGVFKDALCDHHCPDDGYYSKI